MKNQAVTSQSIIQRQHFTGRPLHKFPIDKQAIDNEWICQLKTGSIKYLLDFEEHFLIAEDGQSQFMIVHDGFSFRILEGSPDFEMYIFSISHECLSTLYPFLGGEANSQLFSSPLITSEHINNDIIQMLETSCQELQTTICNKHLLQNDKMILHLLVHIYLLFYSGIGESVVQTSAQPFNITNRLYELFNDEESYKHRDAKYFANKLNISARYFYGVCKKETGHSPKELINETITGEIRHTILTTDLSFKQISFAFNFPDQTAFTQYFKRNVGMTPSDFRKKYR